MSSNNPGERKIVLIGLIIGVITLYGICAASGHLDDLGRLLNSLVTLGGYLQ